MKLFNACFSGLIFISLLSCNRSNSSQFSDDYSIAKEYALQLKNSTLIVRVFTNGHKIKQLQAFVNMKDINPKTKLKLQKQLDQAQSEHDKYYEDLKSVMNEHFTFAPAMYMPDTLFKAFTEGRNDVFWNEKKLIDPAIQLSREEYFVLVTGENPEQLILVNKYLQVLDLPFPSKINVFWPAFKKIFNSRSYLENQVKSFQKKLDNLIS